MAKVGQFWIDFSIRVDTHAKIREWVSKVMRFTVFICSSKQNARGIAKFKTKRMADLREFGTHFDNFAAYIYRKKSLKTQVRGTSKTKRMEIFSKKHATVREIACRSVFLAKMYGVNGVI